MTTTFITGDRSNAGVYVPLVAIEIARALGHGDKIATGDSANGVDAMVRDLLQRADVEFDVLTGFADDFDDRNAHAEALCENVVVIHTAPEKSRAVASFLQNDDVRLVTHMDLLV